MTNASVNRFLAYAFLPTIFFQQAFATSPPDTGSIYREIKEQNLDKRQAANNSPTITTVIEAPESSPATSAKTLFVKAYEIHGNTLLDEADINDALAPFKQNTYSQDDIHEAAEALRQAYVAKGYFAAIVTIPAQAVDQGIVKLDVYEGRFSNDGILSQNSGKRVSDAALQSVLQTQLTPGNPITTSEVERAVLLANDLPGISVSSKLYPGEETGTANFLLSAQDESLVTGNIYIDNFGSYYTGEERIGTTLQVNSPLLYGEKITFQGISSGSDSNYAYLEYDAPIGGDGFRLGASVDYLKYALQKEFKALNAKGKANEVKFFGRYPLVRSRHTNIRLETDLTHLTLKDDNNSGLVSDRDINGIKLSLSGDHDDDYWASGSTYYKLSLTAGDVDIKGNDQFQDFDRQFSNTGGSFSKLNLYLARLQHIEGPLSTFISIDGQFSSKNLDSSQKFFLGGPYSVAGYPIGELSGDDGALFYADLRYDLFDVLWEGDTQISVFYSFGWANLFHETWANWQASNQYLKNDITLQTTGISIYQSWQNKLVVRAIAGQQIGSNRGEDPITKEDSDNSNKGFRLWFQGVYYF